MSSANQTIDVGQLAGQLGARVTRLNDDLVDTLGLLMPAGSYRVALLRTLPYRVTIGTNNDYFAYDQIENEGEVDNFYGFPHHPKVPYYRADRRRIAFPRERSETLGVRRTRSRRTVRVRDPDVLGDLAQAGAHRAL